MRPRCTRSLGPRRGSGLAATHCIPGPHPGCVADAFGRSGVTMRVLMMSLILALGPAVAFGHALSGSYLTLNLDAHEQNVEGRWEIRIADLNDALDLDADGDGAVRWAELDR